MKLKVTKNFQNNFEKYKMNYNFLGIDVYDLQNKKIPVIGKLTWNDPVDVFWLYSTDNEEDYEGSQTQIGIKKDGTVVWGFFSHCSCFGYEDYKGDYDDFVNTEETFKSYEMDGVDKDILIILKQRLKEISKVKL